MPVELKKIFDEMGQTGLDTTQRNFAEGSAGNMSVFIRELSGLGDRFTQVKPVRLPAALPALANGWLVITGSGKRLRDISVTPEETLCVLNVMPDGEQALMYTNLDVHPSIEYDAHLFIHQDQVARKSLDYHSVIHVQPLYLTYITHLIQYSDTMHLNRRLMRWEPEMILSIPEGIELIPFRLPGSKEQALGTIEAMRDHRLVVWQRHGVISRSAQSLKNAADLVEYADNAAHFEYLNLSLGHTDGGMSDEEVRNLCSVNGIKQIYF